MRLAAVFHTPDNDLIWRSNLDSTRHLLAAVQAQVPTAMHLVLAGQLDGCTVNITDEAPTSVYELAQLVGQPLPSSAEPPANPWYLLSDGSLARSLTTVSTVYQAAEQNLL